MGADTMRFPALPVDHNAFRVIDTPQKAYLLGFLLADGCVLNACPGKYRARVNLRIKAVDQKVCRMIQGIAGGNLRLIEAGYRVLWEVNSDQIAHDLIALGVTPRKSFTASLQWDAVPEDLQGAVLAGLIDGDGHLRYSKKARRAEISIATASCALKDQLLTHFSFFHVSEQPPCGKRKQLIYSVHVDNNRERLAELIQFIYANLPFEILDRKQPVLDQLRGYLNDMDAYDARMALVPQLKVSGLTLKEIAEQMGTSLRPVLVRLKALGIDSRRVIFTNEDRQEMMRLHEQGLTVLQIHAAIGKGTEQAVRFHLQRLGCLKKIPKPVLRHPKVEEILTLHHKGLLAYQIAEQVKLGKDLVCKILRQEGVTLTKGSAMKLTPELLALAEQGFQDGRTLQSLADEIGVSTTLIRMRLKAKAKRLKQQ